MKKFILLMPLLFFYWNMPAQSIIFHEDDNERGYYDRPYKRYEAEPGHCSGNADFMTATYLQTELQSEASNQIACRLVTKDSYVEWNNDEAADGLTIRFSLPDSNDGKGTKGKIALYVDDRFVKEIELNSYWAWQYTLKNGNNKYPDNTPASNKFARMRFDETHCRLEQKIPAGAKFKFVKCDDNTIPYIIDFVELESVPPAVTFDQIADANKVMYDGNGLLSFINKNNGKTIYIPEGDYTLARRVILNADNTKLIGAGMWYTNIYFSASSDDRSTYNQRGFETNRSNIVIEGMYINTVNNKRYYNNNDTYQVGKGFMGSFGSNSVIRNVWVEHFECGAWIADYSGPASKNLLVQNSRFRNNYADGINLCSGTQNAIVEKCSFRNNGDDDMASWSANHICTNNTFRYNTAENNWRASSLGFFGGQQNRAHHCVIIDPMEAGLRVTCDFPGTGFGTEGFNEFQDISIYKGGVKNGTVGESGDFWGNKQGAIHINSSSQYDLQRVRFERINIYDSKNDAIQISSSSHSIKELQMRNIQINGTNRYGIYYENARGNGVYNTISYENIGAETNTNAIPDGFIFINEGSSINHLNFNNKNGINIQNINNKIIITGCKGTPVHIYSISAKKIFQVVPSSDSYEINGLKEGIYVINIGNRQLREKILVKKQ